MLSKSDGWRKHFFFSPTWPPGPAGPGSGRGLTWGQVTCGPFLTDWELDQRRVWGATVGAEPVQSADCSPASSLSPTGAVTHSSLTSDPTVVLSGSPELFPLLVSPVPLIVSAGFPGLIVCFHFLLGNKTTKRWKKTTKKTVKLY